MSTHRAFDRICAAAIALAVLVSCLLWCTDGIGNHAAKALGYESLLFDTSYVHTIDIVMDDWDGFLAGCENEEYVDCAVVIDGEQMKNVSIRAKGNTSMSSVRSMNSQRYSFKIEFDHNQKGRTYHGLDKLCLNNLIQDNTMMKDYLSYQMMRQFGVDAPLCSYAYIRVNGEDWGLYLAVESIEDSFLARNYDSADGDLYKPDSMSFGGGRGNGMDFNMDDFDFSSLEKREENQPADPQMPGNQPAASGGVDEASSFGNSMQFPGGMPAVNGSSDEASSFGGGMQTPGSMPPGNGSSNPGGSFGGMQIPGSDNTADGKGNARPDRAPDGDFNPFDGGMPGGFGFGSGDVKLQYTDDDPASYANIFNNAKTDVTEADQQRLIASLKQLNEGVNIERIVDVDEVLRYFVVHNFIRNGDSYTGAMIHNYYLYEQNGQLSMIPWDYNLGFGTFQGGDASSEVNADIDQPVTGGSVSDRPMVAWIFADEAYTQRYHELMGEFIDQWFTSGQMADTIASLQAMLSPYVEKDPTKFCTVEDYEKGVQTIASFVSLRAESIRNQLNGNSEKVDAGDLNLSDMGTMGDVGGGPGGGEMPQMPGGNPFGQGGEMPQMPGGNPFGQGGEMPQMPGGNPFGQGGEMPQMPSGNPFGQGGEMPQMPGGNPFGQGGEMPQVPDGNTVGQ